MDAQVPRPERELDHVMGVLTCGAPKRAVEQRVQAQKHVNLHNNRGSHLSPRRHAWDQVYCSRRVNSGLESSTTRLVSRFGLAPFCDDGASLLESQLIHPSILQSLSSATYYLRSQYPTAPQPSLALINSGWVRSPSLRPSDHGPFVYRLSLQRPVILALHRPSLAPRWCTHYCCVERLLTSEIVETFYYKLLSYSKNFADDRSPRSRP